LDFHALRKLTATTRRNGLPRVANAGDGIWFIAGEKVRMGQRATATLLRQNIGGPVTFSSEEKAKMRAANFFGNATEL
jgi:hypothetical protein